MTAKDSAFDRGLDARARTRHDRRHPGAHSRHFPTVCIAAARAESTLARRPLRGNGSRCEARGQCQRWRGHRRRLAVGPPRCRLGPGALRSRSSLSAQLKQRQATLPH